MKYEPVFGDQSLFDGANDCHVFACKKDGGAIYWHDHSILSAGSVTVRGCIAMRRIIADPKRWTVEDKKAGRLREEWCIKALSSCSILSGMQKYELKRLGGYIEDIYDALLSGDLSTPVQAKDGE